MILSQLSVVFSFLGAAKCMNVGSRDLFIGVGGVAQKEFGNLVETSHLPVINEQSSDFNKEIIPEYSHDFSAKYIYPGPTSFHSQIAQEISTLESNGEQFGELISSSTNHPRYFGEVDDSIFKAHENLVDYPKFQDFIYGDNNLMEAEDQIFPSEFMKPDEYDSLARFKKQRLNDVFPVNSSEKIPHLTNTVNQGNEGSFVSHVNLHEGSTPFFNAHPYPQLDHRLNTISRQALLAQNSLNHDFLNPDATHSAGQNPILPSAHGEYHNSDYIPFSGSDYWSQIFQSTFPNSDNTFDHLLNSQNHHNSYSNTENLPFEQTEIYENTYNRQLENSLDTLIQNNSLGHKNSIMAGNLVINHSSNYRPNMLKKEVHISGSGKESMTENQIIDNSNKQYVTPDKPSKNHKISIVNSVRSEGGSINEFKRNHIPDETTPFVLSTLELQKNNNEIINQLDQTNNPGSSLQTYTESSEANKKSILENLAEVGGKKVTEKINQLRHTPIGGLIDYKLNLFHLYCLPNLKSLKIVFSEEEFINLLSKPSFSYILFEKHLANKKNDILNELNLDYFLPKPSTDPINNIGFKNFEDNKFTLDSQTDLNNFMELFEKNPKLAPLCERSITIDTYIDSIFEKLDLENSRIRKIFKIIQAHKKIQTKSAREMVSRNFSFFCNLIACPYIMNSPKSFTSLKNKYRVSKRFLNEISVQFGLKRINSLGLGGQTILDIINFLKTHFDGKLKKSRAPQPGWCETAVRVILATSNKIILFYRIFTQFDEVCIKNLQESLQNFLNYSKDFFFELYEYFVDNKKKMSMEGTYLDKEEKNKYYNLYLNCERIRFEYDCIKYLFENWINDIQLNSLDQDFIVTKSLRVANFMNDCALVDFFESYKYPLKSYHWN